MSDQVFVAAIGAASALGGALLNRFLGRGLAKAKEQATISASASDAVGAISLVLEQVRVELEAAHREISALREENHALRLAFDELNERMTWIQIGARAGDAELSKVLRFDRKRASVSADTAVNHLDTDHEDFQ